MKINVLTDASGRIIATHYRIAVQSAASPSAATVSRIEPQANQSLHEIELPVELESSILKNTFGRGLASWKVQHEGKAPKLVKVS